MKKITELFSLDEHLIRIDSGRNTIVATRKIANRPFESAFDFNGHPLTDRIYQFLIQHGPTWPSGTFVSYCHALRLLVKFCRLSSRNELTAETFAAFTNWLKTAKSKRTGIPFVENTRRAYGCFLLKFMEWLVEEETIHAREIYLARARHQKAFRGSSARRLEWMRRTAVVPDDFVRLLNAVRLEYEECKKLLDEPISVQDQYEITFPLLPFSMLLGVELAIRSVEFNHLQVSDLEGDRLLLNPPNKESSEVRLTPSLLAAFQIARRWMMRYRKLPKASDPLLVLPVKQGPRADNLVQFDTLFLVKSLNKFYQKYFDILDADGIPTLYQVSDEDESTLRPFRLSFRGFRSAAITQAARYESNPEIVMQFARHKCFDTTMKHYIHETHKQWINNVALCLAPSAELLRISLGPTMALSVEERVAKAKGASIPGGHCAQMLAGDHSCRRAVDCRLCPFFRIHLSKREFFVRELADSLATAEVLQTEEGLSRDAQNMRQFAALNQAIISRIDEHLSRL